MKFLNNHTTVLPIYEQRLQALYIYMYNRTINANQWRRLQRKQSFRGGPKFCHNRVTSQINFGVPKARWHGHL